MISKDNSEIEERKNRIKTFAVCISPALTNSKLRMWFIGNLLHQDDIHYPHDIGNANGVVLVHIGIF